MSKPTQADFTVAIKKALRASGFPFQTRVRHEIQAHNDFTIYASEYPWLNTKDTEEFLDIVATTKQLVLTIECKKAADQDLIFLIPDGRGREIEDFLAAQIEDWKPGHTNPLNVGYNSVNLYPKSPTSEFCVASVSGSSQRLLEKDASALVSATDALAHDVSEYHRLKEHVSSNHYLLIPVLVTNSRMYKIEYNSTSVSLHTGQFEPDVPEIEPVRWLRFTKTFKVAKSRDHGYRSIFVVNSLSLNDFLSALKFAPS
jgi:hypothetical protein